MSTERMNLDGEISKSRTLVSLSPPIKEVLDSIVGDRITMTSIVETALVKYFKGLGISLIPSCKLELVKGLIARYCAVRSKHTLVASISKSKISEDYLVKFTSEILRGDSKEDNIYTKYVPKEFRLEVLDLVEDYVKNMN